MSSAEILPPQETVQESAADPIRVWLRVARLQQRLSGALASELRVIGLSIPQFDVLSTLTEGEGVTQQDLAERLYVTKGNVSGLLDRMEEGGLVERRAIPGDRRSRAVHLTVRGRELAARGLVLQKAFVDATLGTLPIADVNELDRLLRAWRDAARIHAEGDARSSASTSAARSAIEPSM
ncbi:MAG: MarR family transcriptional regulator [Salinarimonadaceae bacterium]|nr:MAG: MarR family transcriptional regulator [Salinarimonadaceae bacterium]